MAVAPGQNLSLVGGTVVSTGDLKAPGGQIVVQAVPGQSTLRISQPGHLLSLEVQPSASVPLTPLTLPQLLTGSGQNTGVGVNSAGQVQLAGSGLPVENGDVVVKSVTSQTATLSAQHNLTLVESQLQTTGDLNLLAKDTVQVRDSVTNPFLAQAGGNLYIQGDRSIDVLALNHAQTPFISGGKLSFVSDGNISLDAHAASGSFEILNLKGGPGNFVSLYDPIISSTGDVTFGNYTGPALKVESLGSISAGNIKITGPDTTLTPGSDPDIDILRSEPAVILRAGLDQLVNPPGIPANPEWGTTFTSSSTQSSPGTITVTGTINTS